MGVLIHKVTSPQAASKTHRAQGGLRINHCTGGQRSSTTATAAATTANANATATANITATANATATANTTATANDIAGRRRGRHRHRHRQHRRHSNHPLRPLASPAQPPQPPNRAAPPLTVPYRCSPHRVPVSPLRRQFNGRGRGSPADAAPRRLSGRRRRWHRLVAPPRRRPHSHRPLPTSSPAASGPTGARGQTAEADPRRWPARPSTSQSACALAASCRRRGLQGRGRRGHYCRRRRRRRARVPV